MSVTLTESMMAPPSETAPSRFTHVMGSATRVLAILVGFSIPVSTSLAEICTGLFLATWLLSGDLSSRWRTIQKNPVALWSLGMFGVLMAGMAWSTVGWREAARCLLKYREFVYLPMLAIVFTDESLRRLGMRAFLAGAAAVLCLSYFEWLSGVDVGMESAPNDFVIAKDRIIHSLLMSLLAYFSALEFMRQPRFRWLYAVLIALAAPNILFLVQGRTGYLLLAVLTTLVLYQQWGVRGMAFAGVLVAITGWGAFSFSSVIRARVDQTISQFQNQFGPEKKRSWDRRLEFYENTVEMVRRHPLTGTGTGSFSHEYRKVARSKNLGVTSDPHNEYLHLASQVGIPGALLFVGLLATQWMLAGRLPEWESRVARGATAAIAVGSLFNSLILSVTGGLIFSFFGGLAFGAYVRPAETVSSAEPAAAPVRQAA